MLNYSRVSWYNERARRIAKEAKLQTAVKTSVKVSHKKGKNPYKVSLCQLSSSQIKSRASRHATITLPECSPTPLMMRCFARTRPPCLHPWPTDESHPSEPTSTGTTSSTSGPTATTPSRNRHVAMGTQLSGLLCRFGFWVDTAASRTSTGVTGRGRAPFGHE